MYSGPHEHSQSATPSPQNQDSNVFPRRGKRRREGRVGPESGEPDVDRCPSLPGAEPSVAAIGKHGQFKGIWKQRTWIAFDGLWGGPKTQGGLGRRGLRQTLGLTQPCLWIRQKTMQKQFLFIYLLGCAGSLLLPMGFLLLQWTGLLSSCWVWVSHWWLLLLWGTGSWACGLQYLQLAAQ